jgi:hypothetical protein
MSKFSRDIEHAHSPKPKKKRINSHERFCSVLIFRLTIIMHSEVSPTRSIKLMGCVDLQDHYHDANGFVVDVARQKKTIFTK